MATLSQNDLQSKLSQLNGWSIEGNFIRRVIKFRDFRSAFSAMTAIALFAEKMDHHPDWSNVYNSIDVKLSTHSEGGITEKDIKLAREIDKICSGFVTS